MKPIIRKILGWTLYIAILVGLVFGIPKGLSLILKTPYPMASITSGSMWPALKKGDLVLIKGVSGKDDIAIGDIVVYQNPKGFTIHRVIEMREDTLVTKGDANNTSDPAIKYSELVGRAVGSGQKPFRIPLLGNVNILVNKFRAVN